MLWKWGFEGSPHAFSVYKGKLLNRVPKWSKFTWFKPSQCPFLLFPAAAGGVHADGSSRAAHALHGSKADQWCAAHLWGSQGKHHLLRVNPPRCRNARSRSRLDFTVLCFSCSTWRLCCCTRSLLQSLWLMEEFRSCWKSPGHLWLLLESLCASTTLPITRTPWKGYRTDTHHANTQWNPE